MRAARAKVTVVISGEYTVEVEGYFDPDEDFAMEVDDDE